MSNPISQPPIHTDRILRIEPGSVVVTVGASGAGKSAWVRRNFDPSQVVSLDDLRRMVCGEPFDAASTGEAFHVLLEILQARARRGVTTVVDGMFLSPLARAQLLEVCARHGRPTVAVCFHIPAELAQLRNRSGGRPLAGGQLREQVARVREFASRWADGRHEEGWTRIVFFGDEDVDLLPVIRYTLPEPLPVEGPFDVIGDVHGCLEELDLLLDRLGYAAPDDDGARVHPHGRVAVLAGDFADRGPDSAGVFRRVVAMHAAGSLLAVPGNHCVKLLRYLRGNHVEIRSGLGETMRDLERAGTELRDRVRDFLDGLPQSLILAGGRLVVFHAALPRDRLGRDDQATSAKLLYGIKRSDEEADPHWTETWPVGPGEPLAVYGHVPVPEPRFSHHTVDIDGGCVFGGYLTAFRWPEHDFEFVSARRVYAENARVDWRGAPGTPERAASDADAC